jgi:hypothetical protein
MQTTAALREDLARLTPDLEAARVAFDRASAAGGDREIARCRQDLAELESSRSDLESAIRGAERYEQQQAAEAKRRAKKLAIDTAHARLDELERQATELENNYLRFVHSLAAVHDTEDKVAGAVGRHATRETESLLTRVQHIVGRLPIEDALDRHPLVGIGDQVRRSVDVGRARRIRLYPSVRGGPQRGAFLFRFCGHSGIILGRHFSASTLVKALWFTVRYRPRTAVIEVDGFCWSSDPRLELRGPSL